MKDSGRLVYTIGLGRREFAEMALALGRSLRLLGDTTPRAVLTDRTDLPWSECFDHVILTDRKRDGFEKLIALEKTDATHILALDGDMLAFKRLDDIFDWCAGKHFCVQGTWFEDGSWWGMPFAEIKATFGADRLPKFNGGLIYYERTPEAARILETTRNVYYAYEESGLAKNRHGQASEELSVLTALMRHPGDWALIPDRLQFQNGMNGPFYDLEMDITRARCRAVCRQFETRYAEPYLFHAYFYRHFLVYWRQILALRRLAAYEANHGRGYHSPGFKLRRSIERRLLRVMLGFKV